MNIGDIMTPFEDLTCVRRGDAVVEAARKMKQADTGVLPIVDDGDDRKLVGVITDRDLAVRVIAAGADVKSAKVGDYCSPRTLTVTSTTSLNEAAQKMADGQVHRLPVVDDGKLVGIVSLADLAVTEDDKAGKALGGISEGAKAEDRAQ